MAKSPGRFRLMTERGSFNKPLMADISLPVIPNQIMEMLPGIMAI